MPRGKRNDEACFRRSSRRIGGRWTPARAFDNPTETWCVEKLRAALEGQIETNRLRMIADCAEAAGNSAYANEERRKAAWLEKSWVEEAKRNAVRDKEFAETLAKMKAHRAAVAALAKSRGFYWNDRRDGSVEHKLGRA
jgi:hypothetical protein